MRQRIEYKLLLLYFKAQHGTNYHITYEAVAKLINLSDTSKVIYSLSHTCRDAMIFHLNVHVDHVFLTFLFVAQSNFRLDMAQCKCILLLLYYYYDASTLR